MENTTYADQSDSIRTLTGEEMAAVSGGAYGTTNYAALLQSSSSWLQNYTRAHPVYMAPVRPVVYTPTYSLAPHVQPVTHTSTNYIYSNWNELNNWRFAMSGGAWI